MKIPVEFENDMRDIFSGDKADVYPAFLSSLAEQPVNGLRTNTLKVSSEELLKLIGLSSDMVNWCESGFYFDAEQKQMLSKSPYFSAGLYYLQEPSAMLPAVLLDVSPGHRVLDLCAAPGGKSTYIAEKLAGKGALFANDISVSRCVPLRLNIERFGIGNSVITAESPEKLQSIFPEYFDRILVDAPCSGEGMFRRQPEMMKDWSKESSSRYAEQQLKILETASKMLRSGGKMVYSTCTFSKTENENVIYKFLEQNKGFSLLPIDHKSLGLEKGIGLSECARIFPHTQKGEGHFVALLQKNGTGAGCKPIALNLPKLSDKLTAPYFEFCKQYLKIMPEGRIFEKNGSLYMLPESLPDFSRLRVARSGLYLGDVKNGRFKASQHLAMWLKKECATYSIDFPATSREIAKYLNGESFDVSTKDGYNLVCVEGYPLGWGKVKDNWMKNGYCVGR